MPGRRVLGTELDLFSDPFLLQQTGHLQLPPPFPAPFLGLLLLLMEP